MTGESMERENAYLTVEAALVFPLVMGMILLVVYLLLFQYDRCLLEQDLGAMALWGGQVEEDDTAALEQRVQTRMAELYREKYVAWEFESLDANLNKNRFSVKGRGRLSFPVPGFNFWGSGNVWEAGADYGYSRFSPVNFIRICRKAKSAVER